MNEINVLLSVEEENENINMNVDEEQPVKLKIDESGLGTKNYEDLINLPKLNGETIIGNMEEKDPTVPSWAKQESKPVYTPEEVDAVPEDNFMTLQEIDELFNSVFN